MGHYKTICKECGTIISQCRCMACDKTIIYDTCNECLDKLVKFEEPSKITGKEVFKDKNNTTLPIRG